MSLGVAIPVPLSPWRNASRHASESASGSRVYPIRARSREPAYGGVAACRAWRVAGGARSSWGPETSRSAGIGLGTVFPGRIPPCLHRRRGARRGGARRRPTRRRVVRPVGSPPRGCDEDPRGQLARSTATAGARHEAHVRVTDLLPRPRPPFEAAPRSDRIEAMTQAAAPKAPNFIRQLGAEDT